MLVNDVFVVIRNAWLK